MSIRRTFLQKSLLLGLFLSLLAVKGECKLGPWGLWTAYASHFIDGQGRVIDPQGNDRSTSEGQAYGLFFALANNDRDHFDRLLNWTQNNMASGDLATHLPGWLWGKDKSGQWKTLDSNPASDADVWMAYTLVEAGRLWKQPRYTTLGRKMMTQIAQREVVNLPGLGTTLIPGPTGFQHGQSWMLNPSYLPLFLFERFAFVDPSGPWKRIAQSIPRLLRESASHGFAMDWVSYVPGQGFKPVTLQQGKDAEVPVGSYDAIRVYLWAGMLSAKNSRRAEILQAVQGMGAYLVNHDSPPAKIGVQGDPIVQDGPVGFSAAVLPYLRAMPRCEKMFAQQEGRLRGQRDQSSGLYGKNQGYYDQNLVLFATGYLEDRFQFGLSGELVLEWARS